jgi:hypothetical protein
MLAVGGATGVSLVPQAVKRPDEDAGLSTHNLDRQPAHFGFVDAAVSLWSRFRVSRTFGEYGELGKDLR